MDCTILTITDRLDGVSAWHFLMEKSASAYLQDELPKLARADGLQLLRAVAYAAGVHGMLTLRDIQIVCQTCGLLRKDAAEQAVDHAAY